MREAHEHKRRVRYKGTHPRTFEEKYKEHDPQKYADTVEKVIRKGSTPAGMHISIMVQEILDFLQIQPGQKGLDATLGYGGHTRKMLEQLKGQGHLYALDVDPIELAKTRERLSAAGYGADILTIMQQNFAGLKEVAEKYGPFDFILADLGVSSMQIDDPKRGFSYKTDGPLDLRMDPEHGVSAAQRLRELSREEIEGMLVENADEPYADRIAHEIQKTYRSGGRIDTTAELREVIVRSLAFLPEDREKKDIIKKTCQRTFQALRIDVNSEFEVLEAFLSALPDALAPGGRVAILTFHSGEDRLVKKAFGSFRKQGIFSDISKEVIRPSAEECRQNGRARSTKMRWACRSFLCPRNSESHLSNMINGTIRRKAMTKEFYMNRTAPIVETPKGKLRGFHYDGVDHFYGIRYAKARRFQMPEPVPAWDGVKDAGSYGMICPVLGEPIPSGEVMTPHRFWPSSEHCQYLNVWTSKCDPKAKKPVMFWIHGGGYAAGSSIEQVCYDGFNLAKLDDVVVVSVNHRLNAFGFLDVSDFGEKYKNSVNVGMADLVEALRWVRDNIACFGGDPENVTIFGQSGGGGKVTVLGQIPEAEGLFHKMIVMSGVIPAGDFDSDYEPKEFILALLDKLNIPEQDVEKLEKVPVPQFIWAVNQVSRKLQKQGKRVGWAPKPNDYYVCDPLEGDFSACSLKIPTIVGSVIAEFGLIDDYGIRSELSTAERERIVKEYYSEEGGQKILEAFREQYPKINEVYAVDLDFMFLPPTVDYVKKKAREASAPVYNYIFAKVFDIDGGRAAWHCSDIPYFFHNAELIPLCHQGNYQKLDRMMSAAFVNFARTGNPNGGELPQWDPCEDGKMVTMVFDEECYTRENMQDQMIPLLRQYKKPFVFDFGQMDNEDEESGNAWVF